MSYTAKHYNSKTQFVLHLINGSLININEYICPLESFLSVGGHLWLMPRPGDELPAPNKPIAQRSSVRELGMPTERAAGHNYHFHLNVPFTTSKLRNLQPSLNSRL